MSEPQPYSAIYPRAIRDDVLVQEMAEGEIVLFHLKDNQAHCLNPTSAAVWRQCDGMTSIATIAAGLESRLGLDNGVEVAQLIVEELRGAHLVAIPEAELQREGLDRRSLVRRVGPALAAAILVPAITSIIAPTPAAASTCIQNGGSCTSGFQCCSGINTGRGS